MELKQEIEEIRDIMIEVCGRAVGEYGMNETIGRIYGLLYFEDEAISLQKIAEKLSVSKATISNNIRLLLELKMVQKSWRKGSRRDFYRAERDFEKIMQEVLRTKELQISELFKENIAKSLEKYQGLIAKVDSQGTKETIEKDIEKLEYLGHWTEKAESWLKFFLEVNFSKEPAEEIKESG
ncbi:MAG: GbsR/MarR family transcriptional regulator [Halanaerobiales bacterium]